MMKAGRAPLTAGASLIGGGGLSLVKIPPALRSLFFFGCGASTVGFEVLRLSLPSATWTYDLSLLHGLFQFQPIWCFPPIWCLMGAMGGGGGSTPMWRFGEGDNLCYRWGLHWVGDVGALGVEGGGGLVWSDGLSEIKVHFAPALVVVLWVVPLQVPTPATVCGCGRGEGLCLGPGGECSEVFVAGSKLFPTCDGTILLSSPFRHPTTMVYVLSAVRPKSGVHVVYYAVKSEPASVKSQMAVKSLVLTSDVSTIARLVVLVELSTVLCCVCIMGPLAVFISLVILHGCRVYYVL